MQLQLQYLYHPLQLFYCTVFLNQNVLEFLGIYHLVILLSLRIPGFMFAPFLHIRPYFILCYFQHPFDDVGGAGDYMLNIIFADLKIQFLQNLLCIQL